MTEEQMPDPIETLRATTRIGLRTSHAVSVVAICLVLDILLTFGFAWEFAHLNTVSKQDQHVSCLDGNRLRMHEKDLWNYVFEKIEPLHPTAAQKVAFDAFEVELNSAMKLRDCQIYK